MRNGKRIFTTAFKSWLIEQAGKPGVSVAGLALRTGLNANQLRRWMSLQHLRSAPPLPALLPVTVSQMPPSDVTVPTRASIIEIGLAGAVVRMPAAVDEQHLRTVLSALRT